jgi:Atg2, N-terminal
MPKRLLQYALSKLEILDTKALDLNNLDIALGKKTVLNFKDVGVRLKVAQPLTGFLRPVLLTLYSTETGNVSPASPLARIYQSPCSTPTYLYSSRCLQQPHCGRSGGS